jgi:hypothetical protein
MLNLIFVSEEEGERMAVGFVLKGFNEIFYRFLFSLVARYKFSEKMYQRQIVSVYFLQAIEF